MKNRYILSLADHQIPISFRHPETALYFNSFIRHDLNSDFEDYLTVPANDLKEWIDHYGMIDNGNAEFGMSIYRISDYLSQFNICMIHGAAFLWHNNAFLFCADSGTGKSTQLIRWMQLYQDEVKVMNGDKPVIRVFEDGSIKVYPSPWKGKEEWGDDSISAPLGGIILLEQADSNEITLRNKHQSSFRIVSQLFSRFESDIQIRNICTIAGALITKVPVWRLRNKGDTESALITHEALLDWERNHGL